MSAAELARRTGISPPSISLWCNGTTKELKGSSLMKAAKALMEKGVPPPGIDPEVQRVRSVAMLLPRGKAFKDAASDALRAEPGKPHASV